MEWYLEEDPGGNKILLIRGITTVGRTAKCTLQLDSSYCSRAHCNIELDEAGNVKISDFSTNGTFVNGKCYISMDISIADGDRIGIGCWPSNTVSGTDKLPVYYIRKNKEIESILQQPDEQDNVSKNDNDEDDGVDLQKYACEDESKQTKEVVVKVETNMDVDENIEPPEFLPAASTSKTSAFISPPANQMVGVFATSELQFQPSKTPSVVRSNGQNNSSLSESDQDQIPNQLHSKQSSRLLSFEDGPISTTAVAQNFINHDVEDMDVDTALSQSVLDKKQEIADLDYEESFEMKAELVAQGLPKSAENAEQMSSPKYLIGDDDEDDEEEEQQNKTKTTDYDHKEYVSESKLEHMDIDDLSQQMRRSLSLDDDLSDLREKKKVNDQDAKQYKPETRSSKKDAECKQKESDTKSNIKGPSKSLDVVDKSETKAGSKHKLDIYDAGPSTSRGSCSGKDNDFIHFEPKWKRPEVIDAPSLPTGKGKLTAAKTPPKRGQNGREIPLSEFKRHHLQRQQPQPSQMQPVNKPSPISRPLPSAAAPPVPISQPPPAIPRNTTQQSVSTDDESKKVTRTPPQNPHIIQPISNNKLQNPTGDTEKSARMLVILSKGEQRLITFTLPHESCTVQELLEQIGVPFTPKTSIQCVPNPGASIDYLVTVGITVQESPTELATAAENSLKLIKQQQESAITPPSNPEPAATTINEKQSLPPTEVTKEPPAKIIPGYLAVCTQCGYSGVDFAKCERCKRMFTEEPRRMATSKLVTQNAKSDDEKTTTPQTAPRKAPGSELLNRAAAKATLAVTAPTWSQLRAEKPMIAAAGRGRGRARGCAQSHAKPAEIEPVVLTLSSDNEGDDKKSNKSMKTPIDVCRMLVILSNGEQRLITFTLPRESCTVQELLEQIGVPFTPKTSIQCVPNPGASIDYIVTVGITVQESPTELATAAENSLQLSKQQQESAITPPSNPEPAATITYEKQSSPPTEVTKELPAKIIPGYLSV